MEFDKTCPKCDNELVFIRKVYSANDRLEHIYHCHKCKQDYITETKIELRKY